MIGSVNVFKWEIHNKVILLVLIIGLSVATYNGYERHLENQQCRDSGGIVFPTNTLGVNYCINFKTHSYFYFLSELHFFAEVNHE